MKSLEDKLKRIAEAVRPNNKFRIIQNHVYDCVVTPSGQLLPAWIYEPDKNDEQALEIVKVMDMNISIIPETPNIKKLYMVWLGGSGSKNANLNQAIVDAAYAVIQAGWKKAIHDDSKGE